MARRRSAAAAKPSPRRLLHCIIPLIRSIRCGEAAFHPRLPASASAAHAHAASHHRRAVTPRRCSLAATTTTPTMAAHTHDVVVVSRGTAVLNPPGGDSSAISTTRRGDSSSGNALRDGVANWISLSASSSHPSPLLHSTTTISVASSDDGGDDGSGSPPTEEEVKLLRDAFASYYGDGKDVDRAYELLTRCIAVWETTHRQGGDEIAGLYRVRGDVDMELHRPRDAIDDYSKAIMYLEGPDGGLADAEELPASRLGRARAVRSMGSSAAPAQAARASGDYEAYLEYTSQEVDDGLAHAGGTVTKVVLDGVRRNPYAAWEWGMVERVAGDYGRAAEVHGLAADAFDDIGDRPRGAVCRLDRGLDLASGLGGGRGGGDQAALEIARRALEEAIEGDVNVEGRDVELLQRLVAKEGEARVALSGVLWSANEKADAETQYGTACGRLDELNADYRAREEERVRRGQGTPLRPRGAGLGYSIDDIVGAEEASCSRFKNEKYVEDRLVWNASLRGMVKKFLTLSS